MLAHALFGLLATTVIAAPSASPIFPDASDALGKTPYSAADPAYNTSVKHFACGTKGDTATENFVKTITKLATVDSSPRRFLRKRANLRIVVPLYMHVVTKSTNAGSVTQATVNQQVRVMNTAYNPFNIFFNLQGTDFTANNAWAVGATDQDDFDMKQTLRRGTYKALNIYLQTDLVGGILGKCSLPTNVGTSPSPQLYIGDGCNCAAGTMPGGSIMGYNMGMTVVHETGHWLGLLHTFEGYSCTGPGDYIPDTAVESESTSGCPTSPWKNTCGRPKGFFDTRKGDPIRNYMDYSIDQCYAGFTQGQIQRINNLWTLYRQNK